MKKATTATVAETKTIIELIETRRKAEQKNCEEEIAQLLGIIGQEESMEQIKQLADRIKGRQAVMAEQVQLQISIKQRDEPQPKTRRRGPKYTFKDNGSAARKPGTAWWESPGGGR